MKVELKVKGVIVKELEIETLNEESEDCLFSEMLQIPEMAIDLTADDPTVAMKYKLIIDKVG